MTDLKIGDAVTLKSGGPVMTLKELAPAHIYSASDAPLDHAICQWFDAAQNVKRGRFALHTLEISSQQRAA